MEASLILSMEVSLVVSMEVINEGFIGMKRTGP
jgi:hypothetical protein